MTSIEFTEVNAEVKFAFFCVTYNLFPDISTQVVLPFLGKPWVNI